MWIDQILGGQVGAALERTAQFAERRQQAIARNIANIDTPGYVPTETDETEFQSSLASALSASAPAAGQGTGPLGPSAPSGPNSRSATSLAQRGLRSQGAASEPANRDAQLEYQVAQLQENAMLYHSTLTLLRQKFDGVMSAIRGRTT